MTTLTRSQSAVGAEHRGGHRRGRGTAAARRCLTVALLATIVTGCARLPALGPRPTPSQDVRGGFGGFYWSVDPGPTDLLGDVDPAAARAQVRRSMAAIDRARDDTFGISILAGFGTAELARHEADIVRDLLDASAAWYADPANSDARRARDDQKSDPPLTPPEEAALRAAGIAPGTRGVGWGGDAGHAGDSVWTIGSIVFVTGLRSETNDGSAEPPLHPIAHLLAAADGEVVVEGDRAGEGSIVTDLSCAPADVGQVGLLLDEIGDTMITGRYMATPPWVARPTAAQAAARAEIRRFQAVGMVAMSDPAVRDLINRMGSATATERIAMIDQLQIEVRRATEAAAQGTIDPEILALVLAEPSGTDAGVFGAWLRQIGGLIGQLPLDVSAAGRLYPAPDDYGPEPWGAAVRFLGDRLEIGEIGFVRTSTGLPLLLAYLDEHGCGNVRYRLVDFDTVRGD